LHGVYHVGAVFERAAEYARQPRITKKLRVVLGEPSVVDETDSMCVTTRDVTYK